MLPGKSHPAWIQLISGQRKLEFKAVAAAMLMARLTRGYAKEPTRLAAFVDEAHAFFAKHEALLGRDIQQIFA